MRSEFKDFSADARMPCNVVRVSDFSSGSRLTLITASTTAAPNSDYDYDYDYDYDRGSKRKKLK